jgi:dTDP-glucose pyrophosphorylase/CBS domain-containing protein
MPNDFRITSDTSILEAIRRIDASKRGAVVVVGQRGELVAVVTDGDVRRGLLAGVELTARVDVLVQRRSPSYPRPLFLGDDSTAEDQAALLRESRIRHLPLVDADGRVTRMVVLDDLVSAGGLPLRAMVMAGGFGKRLWPLTERLPKPMLPVDGKPMMQRLVEQLRDAGIHRMNISTHYMPESITGHFGEGSQFGVEISYVHETEALGTAGALGLMPRPSEPVLVVNADVLTGVNFKAMHEFHEDQQAVLTVGVRAIETQIPYGVVEVDGSHVTRIVEKPVHRSFVSAGVYLLAPAAFDLITPGKRLDMPDLINALVADGRTVSSFLIREYWLDIGHMENYEQAQDDIAKGKV